MSASAAPPAAEARQTPDVEDIAESVHRDFEYCLDWQDVYGENAVRVILLGRIDLLWEDASGWNVLLVRAGADAPGTTLAALAVRQRFGTWPRRILLHDPATGQRNSLHGGPPDDQTLAEFDVTLRRLLTSVP